MDEFKEILEKMKQRGIEPRIRREIRFINNAKRVGIIVGVMMIIYVLWRCLP